MTKFFDALEITLGIIVGVGLVILGLGLFVVLLASLSGLGKW